ncbi:MAG: hypothetical protein LBM56_00840 [Burkholderiaceae bacterium]|jgi:hypothetical protein|nr:hypothetical protein [Burkholderiaceae bacterium]
MAVPPERNPPDNMACPMKFLRLPILALALALAAGTVYAFSFSAVGDEPAILYDAPSYNGVKRFIAPAHMPVEVLFSYQDWTKVRDMAGDMAWIESRALGQKHFVMVKTELAQIHASPDAASPVVFRAKRHVILEKQPSAVPGWIGVSHPDGETGFARADEVWGS